MTVFTEIPTRDDDSPNADADINTLYENSLQSKKTRSQYLLDPQFNFWDEGAGPLSVGGYGALTMWELQLSGATGTLEQGVKGVDDTETDPSKPFFAKIDITGADDNAGIVQSIDGNRLSNKTVIVMIRAKYRVNVPASITVNVFNDFLGSSIGSVTFTGFGTGYAWGVGTIDLGPFTVTDYTGIEVINTNNETWDLDIDQLIIFDKNDLPITEGDGVSAFMAKWAQEDEDPISTRSIVDAYFYRLKAEGTFAPFGYGFATSTSTTDVIITLKETMVKLPTLAHAAVAQFAVSDGSVGVETTVLAISAAKNGTKQTTVTATTAATLTANEPYRLEANGNTTAYLDFDSRY